MRYRGTELVYSPSDLVQFVESPFATWCQRQYLADPASVKPEDKDPLLQVLARRGTEHELGYLGALRSAGREIVELDRDSSPDQTIAALKQGASVIYQAILVGSNFAGYADFLIRIDKDPGRIQYAVWDTKLARQTKPYFLIQLCCYADMLQEMIGERPEIIGVILGDGEEHAFRTSDFYFYYQRVRAAFLALMGRFPDGGAPDPEPSANHGIWAGEAQRWLLARDHLSQVAGISRGQILKLGNANVATLIDLAAGFPGHVRGIGDDVLQRLHRQASLQVSSRGKLVPDFELLPSPADNPRQGLAALPPSSPGDVFFDMEGYPAADDWLEYLFGVVTVDGGKPAFKDWWATSRQEQRAAFEAFVDWAYARWRADPAMHIYHYAAYEPEALKRLMSRYGSREDEIDALLRGEVFVDLYAIVRRGLRIGEPSYSLKNVEHLYREERTGEVQDAGASVVVYDQWCDSGEPPDWRQSPLLKSIRDYNEDDCTSTWQLAQWLRERQAEAGIRWAGRATRAEAEPEAVQPLSEAHEARRQLAQRLHENLPAEDPTDPALTEQRRIQELLAWLVEFHRREDKPMWWQFFARQAMTTAELWEDMDCLADVERVGEPEPIARSQLFEYQFDADQDTKLHEGDKVSLVPDIGVLATIANFDPEGLITLKVSNQKLSSYGISTLPDRTSLIPFDYVKPEPIPTAIATTAERYLRDGILPGALADFLSRRVPRLRSAQRGEVRRNDEDGVAAAIRLARELDSSCLCIQGPPGTGKTWTGARVIIALLKDGKKVGVTSNSHKAILNLMAAVCKAGGKSVAAIKVGGEADDPVLMQYPQIKHVGSAKDGVSLAPGEMVGGTAWLLSGPGMIDSLDYLFVDEAGQVSVANLTGMGRSAKNLILLGDQMQLGQPIQGVHPGESGKSVLDYYLQEHATIPPDLGLFLETSWRMHPEVCRFVSDAVYEGRLRAEPGTANRVIRLPVHDHCLVNREAGIVFLAVEHIGNVQGSDEEVAMIQRVVAELAEREHTDKRGKILGKLDVTKDVLVVAPYNLQVRKLSKALPGVRVGSVDKFQGQEAPVVIVSMCASPGEFGSRGIKFVLDQNRLNVAISRAQSLAIVVGDPRLVEAAAGNVADMRRLNLYCWIQATSSERATVS